MKTAMTTLAVLMTASLAMAAPGRSVETKPRDTKAEKERLTEQAKKVETQQTAINESVLAREFNVAVETVRAISKAKYAIQSEGTSLELSGARFLTELQTALKNSTAAQRAKLEENGGIETILEYATRGAALKVNNANTQAALKPLGMMKDILSGKELTEEQTATNLAIVKRANELANARGQSIADVFLDATLEVKYGGKQDKLDQAKRDVEEYRDCKL